MPSQSKPATEKCNKMVKGCQGIVSFSGVSGLWGFYGAVVEPCFSLGTGEHNLRPKRNHANRQKLKNRNAAQPELAYTIGSFLLLLVVAQKPGSNKATSFMIFCVTPIFLPNLDVPFSPHGYLLA